MSDDYLGIDVSKARLDVHDGASDVASTFSNDESGIAALVSYAKRLAPRLIVLEATGGLGRALIAMLLAAALPVAVVKPAPGTRLRPSEWTAGQDRPHRCAGPCALRASDPAGAAALAR